MQIQGNLRPKVPTTNLKPEFKGYIAAPLKALYMQASSHQLNLEDNETFSVAKQLQDIGDREGFKVYVQVRDRVSHCTDKSSHEFLCASHWGQDNKMIVNKSNGECIVIPALRSPWDGQELVTKFADALQRPLVKTQSEWAGGNVFLGKDDKGEPFAIVGLDVIKDTAKLMAANKAGETYQYKGAIKKGKDPFLQSLKNLTGQSLEPPSAEAPITIEDAKKTVAEDLGVDPARLCVISQPNFHIDMGIRPLNYPYVLVNDFEASINAVQQLKKFLQTSENQNSPTRLHFGNLRLVLPELTPLEKLEKLKAQISYDAKNGEKVGYASTEEVCNQLKSYGFIPIKVPGCFGAGTNFMNAIVHKRPDGKLVYITNKSEHPLLNQAFEEFLLNNAPDVQAVHFIDGYTDEEGENLMTHLLSRLHGGVHCMVTEHPDFQAWA